MEKNLKLAGDDLQEHYTSWLAMVRTSDSEPGLLRLLREISQTTLFGGFR